MKGGAQPHARCTLKAPTLRKTEGEKQEIISVEFNRREPVDIFFDEKETEK